VLACIGDTHERPSVADIIIHPFFVDEPPNEFLVLVKGDVHHTNTSMSTSPVVNFPFFRG
jgi:hypothetical protein